MTVDGWLTALDERHLADLTPSEVTRALRALSSCYVERRDKLARGGALDGAGKRAAFALFYGPQHFFLCREIVRGLALELGPVRSIACTHVIDLGCGTGAAGAAVTLETGAASVAGFDLNPWAVQEANWTYRALGLDGRAAKGNIAAVRIPAPAGALVLAAYAVNELVSDARDRLLETLRTAQASGASLLVVEPIARRVNLWWKGWADIFIAAGGRTDDWRFRVTLPQRQRTLAKAAGLGVQELTARSLYVGGRPRLSE